MTEILTPDILNTFVHLGRLHGVDTTLESLQRRYAFQEAGLPIAALVSMAADLRLEARWTTAKWSQLSKLKSVLPAMLLLRDGSSIILESVTEEHGAGLVAHVTDVQATGEVRASIDGRQMEAIWDGRVLLLKRAIGDDDSAMPFGLPWMFRQIMREGHLFRDIGIASIICSIFSLTPPILAMVVIDRVLVNHSTTTLIAVAVIVVVLIVFEMILMYLRRLFIEIAATRIDGRLQLYVMDRLLRLPMSYFETTPVGYTSSHINSIWKIRQFFTGQLFTTLLDMSMLFIFIPILFLLNWVLTFWVLVLGVIIFFIVLAYVNPLTRLHRQLVIRETEKASYLIETIQGMRAIKSLALEGRRRRGWDEHVARAVSAHHDYGSMTNYPQTFIIPFERLIWTGSLVLGATMMLINPTGAPGMLLAFVLIANRTAQPLVSLARLIESVNEVRGAVGEVASVVNRPQEDTRSENGLRLPIRGAITFDKVRFRYSPGSPLALDDASFEIRPGTIFGIMGRSGSGKTTITRLLQGLNKEYEGSVKIDGMDLREIDLHHLRTNIGVVPQENFLFTGTVRENIGMARPSATFPQIVRAAQLAGAEEFIEKLPRGYDTLLQEGATNLSGGQRQRLALARALLIEPAVLILDEATSALDAESEAIINANLVRIAEDRTIICVSHRLAMLVPSDAILVMEQGRAYDIGRHEELLHRCDIYKLMWHQQNRHLETSTNVRSVVAVS